MNKILIKTLVATDFLNFIFAMLIKPLSELYIDMS